MVTITSRSEWFTEYGILTGKRFQRIQVREIMRADLTKAYMGNIGAILNPDRCVHAFRDAIPLIPGAHYIRRQCDEQHAKFGMWLPDLFACNKRN